jgi:hypothetical protein
VPLDQPGRVVCFPERKQRLTQLLDRFEASNPEQVLLQRADEPFGAAIAVRRADESGRAFDAQEREFLLEVVRHVLRSVIVPHREPAGDVGGEAAEIPPHALTDRFQGLKPRGLRIGVDTDAFSGAMIHRDEHGRRALAGERGRQIGAPHGVDRLRNDGAVVAAWAAR